MRIKSILTFGIMLILIGVVNAQSSSSQNCFISIMDYGAFMDGEQDDSPAIMASIKDLGYAYIPINEHGARVNQTIVLGSNQNLFGQSRASVIKSYVPKGTFAISAQDVNFRASSQIKDITIDVQVEGSSGIQAYETRNVYIDNVAILGNFKCDIGIQLNGGKNKGSAWNQITRYTITRCEIGFDLTSQTKNYWCNRNYIGFGVVQSTQTAVRMYRTSTNTILTCPQDCPIGFDLRSSELNTIESIIENSKTNSIKIDSKSEFNNITGQFRFQNVEDKGNKNEINLLRQRN